MEFRKLVRFTLCPRVYKTAWGHKIVDFVLCFPSPSFIKEIDNGERGVIGDFTTISDIRIKKAESE